MIILICLAMWHMVSLRHLLLVFSLKYSCTYNSLQIGEHIPESYVKILLVKLQARRQHNCPVQLYDGALIWRLCFGCFRDCSRFDKEDRWSSWVRVDPSSFPIIEFWVICASSYCYSRTLKYSHWFPSGVLVNKRFSKQN